MQDEINEAESKRQRFEKMLADKQHSDLVKTLRQIINKDEGKIISSINAGTEAMNSFMYKLLELAQSENIKTETIKKLEHQSAEIIKNQKATNIYLEKLIPLLEKKAIRLNVVRDRNIKVIDCIDIIYNKD